MTRLYSWEVLKRHYSSEPAQTAGIEKTKALLDLHLSSLGIHLSTKPFDLKDLIPIVGKQVAQRSQEWIRYYNIGFNVEYIVSLCAQSADKNLRKHMPPQALEHAVQGLRGLVATVEPRLQTLIAPLLHVTQGSSPELSAVNAVHQALLSSIDSYFAEAAAETPVAGAPKIFIAHGANHAVRDAIIVYLNTELRLNISVMQHVANAGRALPEKFEEAAAGCNFAVFILSADDHMVDKTTGREVKRARQNVILEVGYFWGLLGRRAGVAFLVEKDPLMELPSDIEGIAWIPITPDLSQTKLELLKELRHHKLVS